MSYQRVYNTYNRKGMKAVFAGLGKALFFMHFSVLLITIVDEKLRTITNDQRLRDHIQCGITAYSVAN